MFKTDRTVYRTKEGIYDLMDENNINVVSGYIPFKNKTEKKEIWKRLKQEFGNNIQIVFKDKLIEYTCNVDRYFVS
jgi:hypothetical protein